METGAPDYERPMYPDYFHSKGLIVEYHRFYKSIPSVCGRIRIERIAVCRVVHHAPFWVAGWAMHA